MQHILLEGLIKVTNGTSSGLLKPGQQAQIGQNLKVISGVSIDEVMAGKNWQFYLSGTDIKTVMKQVERWYDVEPNDSVAAFQGR